jgi:hypothetical protein
MPLSARFTAGLSLVGVVCDAVGGLYLAYDIFRRHAGPLGLLTRLVTYSIAIAIPSWIALGPAFGVIMGCGVGLLLSFDNWLLARRQRLQLNSPIYQSPAAGATRGLVLGLAAVPRFGWRFGLVFMGAACSLMALVYGLGFVPTYRPHEGRRFSLPRSSVQGSLVRALTAGAGAAVAGLIVRGLGEAESLGLLFAFLLTLISVVVAVITPLVEYWTENAPDAFFIYAGLSLLFCGLICDSIPQVAVLLGPR